MTNNSFGVAPEQFRDDLESSYIPWSTCGCAGEYVKYDLRPFTPDELKRAERALERYRRHTSDSGYNINCQSEPSANGTKYALMFLFGMLAGCIIYHFTHW